MKTHAIDDKARWGPGPWQDEPDKVAWLDEATGLDCMVLRGPTGAWCGYVGVGRGHPWHGRDYAAIEAEVHGGLNFSGNWGVEVPGLWWVGFDCGHLDDYSPAYAVFAGAFAVPAGKYRDLAYVTAQVRSLARQAEAAA